MLNYYSTSTDANLEQFIRNFSHNRRPINVYFRNIVSEIGSLDRATHQIHSYPAKMLVHIPYFFLSNNILSKQGDRVLDPFSGSGTVLLEAQLSGRRPFGADINPLARLISKVKTTPIPIDSLEKSAYALLKDIRPMHSNEPPDVVNIKYWFYPEVIDQLCCILEAIERVSDKDIKDFFLVCFSSCIRKVSLANPRFSVPVKLRPERYPKGHHIRYELEQYLNNLKEVNVIDVFYKQLNLNILRMKNYFIFSNNYHSSIVRELDARSIIHTGPSRNNNGLFRKNYFQLIITSPPYPGAQKYIRSSSLNMGWLKMCSADELVSYKYISIGREEVRSSQLNNIFPTNIYSADDFIDNTINTNQKRAVIANNYIHDMKKALAQMYTALKPNGYLVVVAANNNICGNLFNSRRYINEISEELGFQLTLCLVDSIRSRGLITKRNNTAGIITSEYISVYKKGK